MEKLIFSFQLFNILKHMCETKLTWDRSSRGRRTEDFERRGDNIRCTFWKDFSGSSGDKDWVGDRQEEVQRTEEGWRGNGDGLPGHPFWGWSTVLPLVSRAQAVLSPSPDIQAQVSSFAASGHWDPVQHYWSSHPHYSLPLCSVCLYERPSKAGGPLLLRCEMLLTRIAQFWHFQVCNH